MNGIEPQGKPWTQEATHKTHPGASPGEFLRLKFEQEVFVLLKQNHLPVQTPRSGFVRLI